MMKILGTMLVLVTLSGSAAAQRDCEILGNCELGRAQPVATAEYYASGSFVVPANVYDIRIEVWGGGGGGGASCYSNRTGGNGGNGSYSSAAFKVYPGMILAIQVGQGGPGGCGGGGGGGGGNVWVTGQNISMVGYGGGGGEGTGGGCAACGGNGGTGRALISWFRKPAQ